MIFPRILLCISLLLVASLSSHEPSRRIGIVTSSNYVGDRETAWRMKIAAERLGWTVLLDEWQGYQIRHMKLDWVICMLPGNKFFNRLCPNYLMVFHPFGYLNHERKFLPFYQRYDGYLLTIHDRETLADSLKQNNKEFHCIPFFPTVFSVPYQRLSFDNLMTMIPVWGDRVEGQKYQTLYRMLSQTGAVKFYGVHRNEHIISEGYMGPIPFDGISVINVLQKHGIVLVIHSDVHNANRIPTSRIFEAAAASAVVISDQNQFVKEHFGDSVFYIDTSLSAEEIFDQIQGHLKTIHTYPELAANMAKRAHDVFMEKFEMSQQLLLLEQMHEAVISKKK